MFCGAARSCSAVIALLRVCKSAEMPVCPPQRKHEALQVCQGATGVALRALPLHPTGCVWEEKQVKGQVKRIKVSRGDAHEATSVQSTNSHSSTFKLMSETKQIIATFHKVMSEAVLPGAAWQEPLWPFSPKTTGRKTSGPHVKQFSSQLLKAAHPVWFMMLIKHKELFAMWL